MLQGVGNMGLRDASYSSASAQPAGVPNPLALNGSSGREAQLLNARLELIPPAWVAQPKGAPATTASEATKRGLRFEAKVHAVLTLRYGRRFLPSPSFSFQTNSRKGRCIPDGLLLGSDNQLAVIEVKYTHTEAAWWQLEKFYAPIVKEAFRFQRIVCAEICHVYDPWVKLPKAVALVYDLEEAFEVRECFHPVMVLARH